MVSPNQLLALAVAGFSDLLDFLIVGLIPGLGDILDLFTIGILYFLLRNNLVFVGAIEFIPFVDILPTYTAIVIADVMGVKF